MANGPYAVAKTKLAPYQAKAETDISSRLAKLKASDNWRKENLALQKILEEIFEKSRKSNKFGWVPFVGEIENAINSYQQKKSLKAAGGDSRLKKYEGTAFGSGVKRFDKDMDSLADKIDPLGGLVTGLIKDWVRQGIGKKVGTSLTGDDAGFFGKGDWKPFQNLKGDKGLFEGLWSDFGTGKGALAKTFKNIGEKGLFKAKPGITPTDKMGYSIDPTYGEIIQDPSIMKDIFTYSKGEEEKYDDIESILKLWGLSQSPKDVNVDMTTGDYLQGRYRR